MKILTGTRAGFWHPVYRQNPFQHLGFWQGKYLGDHIPGYVFEQDLLEFKIEFHVQVLYRPDLDKRSRLETVLIFDKYDEKIWDYDCWSRVIN
jgi:hypothetical protein